MASLDPLHPLQSSVIELLAAEGHLSPARLKEALESQYKIQVSVPHLYRLLAQLHKSQVIVRTRGSVSLNSVWISYMARFLEKMKQKYSLSGDVSFDFCSLKEGEIRSFFADSLTRLDPAWNHAILELTKLANTKDWYIYNSHPWYSIGTRETEARLYRTLIAEGIHCHMLYGNDSYLDRYGEKIICVEGFSTARTANPPLLPEGHALWICGDYLIECIMPDAVSRHFAFFFRTVESVDQFDPQLFADVFSMRAKCKVSVRRRKNEAERVRGMLRKYF